MITVILLVFVIKGTDESFAARRTVARFSNAVDNGAKACHPGSLLSSGMTYAAIQDVTPESGD
jgi:hypothetical protein